MQDNGKLRVRKENVNIEHFITVLKRCSKMITVSYDRTFVHAFLYKVENILTYSKKKLDSMPKLDIILRFDPTSHRLHIYINNSLRKMVLRKQESKRLYL
jgi:hypothetical protein